MLRIILGFLTFCSIYNFSLAQQSAVSLCDPSKYQFHVHFDDQDIEDSLYNSSDKLYICKNTLPAIISLFDIQNQDFITATDVTWSSNIDASFGETFQAQLREEHFDESSNLIIISADFTDGGSDISINFKISKNIDFYPEPNIVRVGYDENKIIEYTPSATDPPGLPWILSTPTIQNDAIFNIRNLSSDTFPVDINHNTKLKISDNNILVDHYEFKSMKDTFSLSNISSTGDSVYIEGCCSNKKMMIYTKGIDIEIPLRLIVIGESDDDEILYCPTDNSLHADCNTPIIDPNFQCIDKGPDGSYEEQLKIDKYALSQNLYFKTSWVDHLQDSIIELSSNTNDFVIVAGSNLTCNTQPISKDTFFDPLASILELEKMLNEANMIYNPIGINFIFDESDVDTIILNFDIISNNANKLDNNVKRIGNESLPIWYELNHYQDDYINVVPLRWISYPSTALNGFAWRGTSKIVMNTGSYNVRTFAHEIGHARWSLLHCDDNKGFLNDDQNSTTTHTNVNDKSNYMFSSYDSNFTPIIRHYQWKKIFTNSYN